MPTQVLPITDLAKAGLIMDLPSVSLPPNVYSDCRNVRFRDGAIRKMEGEEEILLNFNTAVDLIFTCYWPAPELAPDNGYIVVVARPLNLDPNEPAILADTIHLFNTANIDGATGIDPAYSYTLRDVYTPETFWQHSLFGGGNTLIMNNRTSKPIYITDINQGFFDLPGWDSYLVDEQVTSFFYDTAFLTDEGTDLGQFVNLQDSLVVAPAWDINRAYETQFQVEYNGRLYEAARDSTGAQPDISPDDWIDRGLDGIGVETLGDQNILVTVIPADTRISPFSIRVDDYLEPIVYANGVELWDSTATYVNDSQVLFEVGGVVNRYTATLMTGEVSVNQPPNANPSVWTDNGRAEPVSFPASVGYNVLTGTTFITFAARELNADGTVRQQGVLANDSVTIRIQTEPEIQVRAGVIRTYGDLLIAGNLTEMDRTDVNRVVRNLPGVIRTSDVAAPGSIPANWNPFKTGVNTADEFTLSSTGIVQDMVELQGIMYIYTNESIHSVQQTGNNALPFNIRPVAHGWGAQTIDAVQEFDGKHIIVGTSDIFVFACLLYTSPSPRDS